MNGNSYQHLNGHVGGGGQPSNSTGNDIVIPQGATNQPRVLLRKLDENDAVFQLSGVETGYANSLRRVMMADVPTIGESHVNTRIRERQRAYEYTSKDEDQDEHEHENKDDEEVEVDEEMMALSSSLESGDDLAVVGYRPLSVLSVHPAYLPPHLHFI